MDSKVILFLLSFLLSCNQLLPPPKIEEEKISTSGSSSDKISTTDKFKVGNCSYPRDKKFFVAIEDLDCTVQEDEQEEPRVPKNIVGLDVDEDDKLYALDKAQGLFISSDNGRFFKEFSIKGVKEYQSLKVHKGVIYVIANAILYISTDGGKNFMSIDTNLKGTKIKVFSRKQTVSNIVSDHERQMSIMIQDYIYISSDTKIEVFKREGKSVKTFFSTFDEKICSKKCTIFDLSIGSNGHWYVATSEGISVSINNGETFKLESMSDTEFGNNILSVFHAPDGNVYYNSSAGVGKFEQGAKSANFILSDDQQPGLKFNKIFINSSKELYAASDKGLHQGNLEFRKFEFFDSDDGLADNNLSLIKVDSKGNVFVGSDNGLSVSIKE